MLHILKRLPAYLKDVFLLTLLRPRPDGFVDPEDVRAAITPRTRLVICTHASNAGTAAADQRVLCH